MKGKALLFVVMLLSVLAMFPIPVFAGTATVSLLFVEIDGSPITPTPLLEGPPPDVCHTFTIAIHIEGVEEQVGHGCLFNWVAAVYWTAGVISVYQSFPPYYDIVEGPFMKDLVPPGKTSFLYADPTTSSIPDMGCTFLVEEEACGSGDLAYITFHVDTAGSTDICIEISLYDFAGESIPVITECAHFEIPPPPATPPEARFTPPTCTFVYVGDTVVLDASTSSGGWDTVPEAGEYCPILSYTWEIDFGDDGSIDLYLDGEITEFTCPGPGDVAITLIIYAPDPTAPNTDVNYLPYNDFGYRDEHTTETHIIHQREIPTGPNIDVYTEKGGVGPGYDEYGEPYPYPAAWSDAFGPQEAVTVCALVTYNEEPVENKLVAFEVIDPNGTTRATRTAATDADGIACVEFRIPWEGSGAEDMFGDWAIIACVDIAETIVCDIVQFKFGYILSILEVIVLNSPVLKGENLEVQADIQNIAMVSVDTTLTIVLYDECGVPIGMAHDEISVAGEDGLSPIYYIEIPTWAFVGWGTVYVNLFTDLPSAGGTPFCPEKSAPFQILKTP